MSAFALRVAMSFVNKGISKRKSCTYPALLLCKANKQTSKRMVFRTAGVIQRVTRTVKKEKRPWGYLVRVYKAG
jgi:hypothetical protein